MGALDEAVKMADQFDEMWTFLAEHEPDRIARPGWRQMRHQADAFRGALSAEGDASINDAMADTATRGRGSDPSTSSKAVDIARWRSGSQKFMLAEVFFDARGGLTAEEAVRRAGLEGRGSPWHRVSDLKAANLITPTGEERLNESGASAEVLAMTATGRQRWSVQFRGAVA